MTTELFVKIILSVITIIGALVSAYVIPFLKSKVSEAETEKLLYYVTVAVRCAEQIYTPDKWREKKQYVMNYILNVIDDKIGISLTEGQLDAIVEGIVNEVKHGGSTSGNGIAD